MPRKRWMPKGTESCILWDYGIRETFDEALAVAVKRGGSTVPIRLPDGKWVIAANTERDSRHGTGIGTSSES
jgi:hypothetical protein